MSEAGIIGAEIFRRGQGLALIAGTGRAALILQAGEEEATQRPGEVGA